MIKPFSKHAALAAMQVIMLYASVASAAEEPLPPDQAFKVRVFRPRP